MAGSYKHAVADDGQLYVNEHIDIAAENMGDAYETIQQMYGMIWYLAAALANNGWTPDNSDPVKWVEEARQNYQRGLELSPGTDGHPAEDDR